MKKRPQEGIRGIVVEGQGWGRDIGYPTANIDYEPTPHTSVLPGVFAATVWYNHKAYPGFAVVGMRKEKGKPLFEVYILNLGQDLYGQHLEVTLDYYIRDLIDFPSHEALIVQIKEDIDYVYRNRPNRWKDL